MEMISLVHAEDGGIDYEKSLKRLFKSQNEIRNWINMFEERFEKAGWALQNLGDLMEESPDE
jgi:hypothetical protein